jgi:phospholipase D3/4
MKTPIDIKFLKKDPKKRSRYVIFAFLLFLAFLIITVVALHSYLTRHTHILQDIPISGQVAEGQSKACKDSCTLSIVESIPQNLTYPSPEVIHPSIYSGWLTLMQSAEDSLDIASSYWTLRGKDTGTDDPSTAWGENIFNELIATAKRGITAL